MTKNAEIILQIINNSNCHLTAEEIYHMFREGHGKVVLATVYNNLNMLSSKGYIRRIVLPDSPDRYDKLSRHDHLVCSECGKIEDFYFDDITRRIEEKIGAPIEFYDLNISYVCPDCRKKRAEARAEEIS